MKVMLLAGLYLFFVRVLWSVFGELRDPRTVARRRPAPEAAVAFRATDRQVGDPVAANPARAASAPVATALAVGQLRVIDPPTSAGALYRLGRDITIGRAATNGIVLDDTYVSTVHARIFVANDTYFIEDLASRNGCSLNGQQVVATTALVPGDRLQVGATTMEFI